MSTFDTDAASPALKITTRGGRMAKKWIAGAIKHPGAERRAAKRAGMSTRAYEEKNKHKGGVAGARARLGLKLSSFRKK